MASFNSLLRASDLLKSQVVQILGPNRGAAHQVSLDDCVRRLNLETGELSAPVELKEFVVAGGWLDAEETMLLLVSGKRLR